MALDLKSSVRASVPWVQILHSAPFMVSLVKRLTRRIVAPVCVGLTPTWHPNYRRVWL